jgi:hypothetical protein
MVPCAWGKERTDGGKIARIPGQHGNKVPGFRRLG